LKSPACSCVSKKNLNEIYTGPWVEKHGEKEYSVEPSFADVEKAITDGTFETRGFQNDIKELTDEWNRGGSLDKYLRLRRQYHTRRIAHFVVHPSSHPVVLDKNTGGVKEGLHRLKAAKYKGVKEVCVRLE
jgi:hypothetical protein